MCSTTLTPNSSRIREYSTLTPIASAGECQAVFDQGDRIAGAVADGGFGQPAARVVFEVGDDAVLVGDAERPPHPVMRRDVDLVPGRVGILVVTLWRSHNLQSCIIFGSI